jgi:sec-independent protein translocase protein TatC
MTAVADLVEGFRTRSGGVSFLDRLDHLRGRLVASLIAVIITTIIGFYIAAYPLTIRLPAWGSTTGILRFIPFEFQFAARTLTLDVLGLFVDPIQPYLGGEKIKYLSPTDPFMITLKLAFCIGIMLALPYLLRQIWSLVAPLMRPEEKRLVAPSIVAGVLLFVTGVVFCYYLVLPITLRFTMSFQAESLEQNIVIGEYLSTVLQLLLAFGMAFELPIILVLGTALGIVTPAFLVSKRRHAIAVMTILSAIVTPPDLGSQILMLVPLLLLYEISILLSRGIVRRRALSAPALDL